MSVDECPAGEAMNWAIAEVLTGHKYKGSGKLEERDGTISDFCTVCGECWGYHYYDNYRCIENAWRLFERLKHSGATLGWTHDWLTPYVSLPVPDLASEESLKRCGTVYGENHAEAICRAFLKANGIEYVEIKDESAS